MTGPRRGYRLQKASLCSLICAYCQTILTCTPQNGHHGITKVTKNTDIAKIAENCMSTCSSSATHKLPPPPFKKVGFKRRAGALGGIPTKNHWGMFYWAK